MTILPNITVKKVRGLEWHESVQSSSCFAHCLLVKSRNKIELIEQGEIDSFEDFVKEVKTDIPLVLNVTGKGILAKIIAGNVEASEQTLQMLLPHAALNDFYIQVVPLENYSLVSIVRRTKVDDILKRLTENKYRVIDLIIGINSLPVLAPILEETSLMNRDYFLSLIPEIYLEKNLDKSVNYTFGDNKISEKQISSLGAAWSIWFPTEGMSTVKPSLLQGKIEEERQRRMFKLIGTFALVFFFLSLAINLVVFQKLTKEVATLQQKTFVNKGFLRQMDSLNQELAIKEQLAESTGIKKASRITFFADKIAETVPNDIKLKVMAINENTKKVKAKKRIVFADNEIRIAGNSKTTSELNDWINELEKLDFTSRVGLINYTGSGKQKGEFEINITVK